MAAHDHDHNDGSNLSEMELRVRALETILVEKGYVETAALDRIVELYENKIGPHIGAQASPRRGAIPHSASLFSKTQPRRSARLPRWAASASTW